MTVSGFTLDKNDPTKRIPYEYNDHMERSWCEAAELADAECWEEADAKLTEYLAVYNGFIRGSRDADLNAKIAVGLAKTKLEDHLLQVALEATTFAISEDDGGSHDHIHAAMLVDIAKAHVKKHVPGKVEEEEGEKYYVSEYAKATTENLCTVANALLPLFHLLRDKDMDIASFNDDLHDMMCQIVDELLNRKEVMDKARLIVKKLLELDVYDYYTAIAEEWNKTLCGAA